jgi:hypothetical protein
MKKFILLLLLSACTLQGQTRSQIQVQIDAIATGVPNTALKVRTILNTLANGAFQTGDIKEIDVSTAYIASNFDVTGLGTNERLGWAICNGNNGTRNRNGRVSIQYDVSNYPTLGATGGSKDAVVVAHSHNIKLYNVDTTGTKSADASGTQSGTGTTEVTGESGTDKNLQPYIVTLMIMKL